MVRAGVLAVVATLISAGCSRTPSSAPVPAGAEGVSLLGTPLISPAMPSQPVQAADSALALAPDDPDRLLAAAGARATAWRFREAIEMYSRGMQRWPNDARFPRFRGHRHLTLRRFAEGAADLDLAARLDSTNFDVIYHQGLAHYLLGHYGRAADVYAKCLGFATNEVLRQREASGAYRTGYRSCMRMATDDDARVAMSDWAWRALTRAGRVAEATRVLEPVHERMTVNANRSYFENLLMYKGARTPDQVMLSASTDSVRFSTSGYAVANFFLVRGDSSRAWELFDRVARSPHWNGFGVVAAEAELVRRRR